MQQQSARVMTKTSSLRMDTLQLLVMVYGIMVQPVDADIECDASADQNVRARTGL